MIPSAVWSNSWWKIAILFLGYGLSTLQYFSRKGIEMQTPFRILYKVKDLITLFGLLAGWSYGPYFVQQLTSIEKHAIKQESSVKKWSEKFLARQSRRKPSCNGSTWLSWNHQLKTFTSSKGFKTNVSEHKSFMQVLINVNFLRIWTLLCLCNKLINS